MTSRAEPRRANIRAAPPSCVVSSSPPHSRLAQRARGEGPDVGSGEPNPDAPVPPLVSPAKEARFRILLYTWPYYKAFYVARLFLVIPKENFKNPPFTGLWLPVPHADSAAFLSVLPHMPATPPWESSDEPAGTRMREVGTSTHIRICTVLMTVIMEVRASCMAFTLVDVARMANPTARGRV